ncbi:MAG: hypothetical protein HOE90_13640 [Bacteriovoracaceae bacterium]|nr:hypothetical protein [Bacteriovoracaceae bacterium]
MRAVKNLLGLFLLTQALQAFGYGTGMSTYPTGLSNHTISAEMLGVVNNGKGLGIQGRYMFKASSAMSVEVGAGLSGGERSNRFFAGADYMFLPDYEKQPRFSVKGLIENAEENGKRINILSMVPTVSKGFNFWGTEAYPFVAVPISLGLEGDSKTYESMIQLSLGGSGKIPVEGYDKFIAHIEGNINIKDAYHSVAMGISYPID